MKELSNTFDYYILPNKILCSIVGMWPIEQKSSTCSKIFSYVRLTFTLISLISVFVPEIMLIAVNWGNIEILAGAGSIVTTLGQTLFKMFYLIARRERSYMLYYEIKSLWDTANDSNEIQSYIQFAYWARICTIVFYSSCVCNVITFSSAAAVDYFRFDYNANSTSNSRHLPFIVWYGTDISASPKFEIAFICQLLSAALSITSIAGLDCSFMTTMLHVSAQFKLINTWISNIGTEINCNPNYTQKIKVDLTRCIRHHQRIIHGIEVCLSGYAILDTGKAEADLVKFISYFISMAVHLLLWCWPGEILVQESQEIGHAVYFNVPWYDLPPIYQRHLCLMIVRAQQYSSISALTFQTLSIHTLTAVFNTAASYFTLLQQIQQT
ncbi:odorant receptor 4-like isoform X2 [Bombus huntii]|uniref:odorant receptor 4-like isoform X2 n=1 Tax=Bombus huntii TaxID=85661 RepID=UPI0021A9AFFC|nr:odorant receptor 4-like isoform X2 [Bombus huntii]